MCLSEVRDQQEMRGFQSPHTPQAWRAGALWHLFLKSRGALGQLLCSPTRVPWPPSSLLAIRPEETDRVWTLQISADAQGLCPLASGQGPRFTMGQLLIALCPSRGVMGAQRVSSWLLSD